MQTKRARRAHKTKYHHKQARAPTAPTDRSQTRGLQTRTKGGITTVIISSVRYYNMTTPASDTKEGSKRTRQSTRLPGMTAP